MLLLSEIKRRNVFRVTAAYLVVGWLTLQVSDILLDFAGAPEWVGKAIIAVLLLGLILTSDFSLMHGRSELLYRALTDPDFDFDPEAAVFEIEYRAIHGNYDVANFPFAFILKQYDELTPSFTHTLWWNDTDPDFLKSPHRKRLIREAGLPEFWREHGYPPQCRAVGDDDFECD